MFNPNFKAKPQQRPTSPKPPTAKEEMSDENIADAEQSEESTHIDQIISELSEDEKREMFSKLQTMIAQEDENNVDMGSFDNKNNDNEEEGDELT